MGLMSYLRGEIAGPESSKKPQLLLQRLRLVHLQQHAPQLPREPDGNVGHELDPSRDAHVVNAGVEEPHAYE